MHGTCCREGWRIKESSAFHENGWERLDVGQRSTQTRLATTRCGILGMVGVRLDLRCVVMGRAEQRFAAEETGLMLNTGYVTTGSTAAATDADESPTNKLPLLTRF